MRNNGLGILKLYTSAWVMEEVEFSDHRGLKLNLK